MIYAQTRWRNIERSVFVDHVNDENIIAVQVDRRSCLVVLVVVEGVSLECIVVSVSD